MAWWTHILFFSEETGEKSHDAKVKNQVVSFYRALKEYIYKNFVDGLYVVIGTVVYLYLGLSILDFFLHEHVPRSLSYFIESFSEPYLGALGIYVVVKEIMHRRDKTRHHKFGDIFVVIWLSFLVAASVATYTSSEYQLGPAYKTVVTNSLAALIIRIGVILR